MKKLAVTAFIAAFAAAPALANGELEEYCVAYTTESGGDSSGCGCLAEAADDSMAAELMAVASEADVEALSDASKQAIATCWPDAA